MKSKTRVLVTSCIAILVGGCLIIGYCSQRPRKKSSMFNFVFPPGDIYQPLAQLPFSTSSVDNLYESSFATKYPGNHSIEVIVTKPVKVMESYDETFALGITIKDGRGAVLIEEVVAPPYSPFWGINEKGLKLLNFRSPDDVPLSDQLTAHIRLKVEDSSFEDKYGPLTLRIVKISDE